MSSFVSLLDGDTAADTSLLWPSLSSASTNPSRESRLIGGVWSDGPFDCFDTVDTAVCACVCPCHVFAWTLSAVGMFDYRRALVLYGMLTVAYVTLYTVVIIDIHNAADPDGNPNYRPTMSPSVIGIVSAVLFLRLVVCCISVYYRRRLRQRYDIAISKGTFVRDAALHCCCAVCALAQESRHVRRDTECAIQEQGDGRSTHDASGGRTTVSVQV